MSAGPEAVAAAPDVLAIVGTIVTNFIATIALTFVAAIACAWNDTTR